MRPIKRLENICNGELFVKTHEDMGTKYCTLQFNEEELPLKYCLYRSDRKSSNNLYECNFDNYTWIERIVK